MKEIYFTKRQRLLAALHAQEVDRLPWSPLIDPYFINSLPRQGIHLSIIEAMRYIGNDIMERHVAKPEIIFNNTSIHEEISSDKKHARIYYETPVGSIYEEKRNSGQTGFITKHLIEDIEDVKVYQYMVEHSMCKDNITAFVQRDNYIGDDGIATTSGPMSPIQLLLQKICGVENTVYLLADYPDEMEQLFHSMHEANKKTYEVIAHYPTEVIFDYEDTSSSVMSKNMFTDYSVPAINDYSKILHDSGKLFITHMCGCLNVFKEEIGHGLQDGIDSVCPPSTGDLYIWDARKAWGKNKVVIGGIDPPDLSRMTADQCEKTVLEIIEKLDNKRGFILSTGDAVPYGTPIENLIAITRLIEKLGSNGLK